MSLNAVAELANPTLQSINNLKTPQDRRTVNASSSMLEEQNKIAMKAQQHIVRDSFSVFDGNGGHLGETEKRNLEKAVKRDAKHRLDELGYEESVHFKEQLNQDFMAFAIQADFTYEESRRPLEKDYAVNLAAQIQQALEQQQ